MTDLSKLSDEELRALYSAKPKGFLDVKSLSNEELTARYNARRQQQQVQATSAQENMGGTLPFFGMNTGIPVAPELEASLIGSGKMATRVMQGVRKDSPELAAQVADESMRYAPLEKAFPKATLAGEIAPFVAAPFGIPGMMAASALEYGTPAERTVRAGAAGVGGLAGKALGRAMGPQSMKPRPANDFFGSENKWGIPLTMGQTSDGKAIKTLESVVSNIPFGGSVNKARDESFQAFNKAVANTFGENTGKITPKILGDAKDRAGGQIGTISARSQIDAAPLFKTLNAASRRASQDLTEDEAKIVDAQIQRIWRAVDPETGQIPGGLYKAYQSHLGKLKQRGGTFSDVIQDVRNALLDARSQSIPKADSEAWAKANREYFNLRQVGDATKSTPGELSPTQLLAQINKSQPNSRFGGGNELAEIARFAQQTLPDKIPNSGTAQRAMWQKVLTNPAGAGAGLLGLDYGARQAGFDPNPAYLAAPVGLTYATARFLSGKPPSDLVKKLLERGGGLLGLGALQGLATRD